jgi:pyridoxal phosphate enzyme (YggS family)
MSSSIYENFARIKSQLPPHVTLIAVSKTKPVEVIQEAYATGHRVFGENRVQELVPKYEALPKDIVWHLIGHLQSNKVKYIAPFVAMIHSVDSFKLAEEINKQAAKNNRTIDILLQVFIAQEETKFGLSPEELIALLQSPEFQQLQHIRVRGLMGMATNTDNKEQVRAEFRQLKQLADEVKAKFNLPHFDTVSMGMSGDFPLAVEAGSTMVRVGSLLFGER